jgi:hypothetical protein
LNLTNNRIPVTRGFKIQLLLIHPIYKQLTVIKKTANGTIKEQKSKLKKEIRVVRWINMDAITSIEQYITTKNTIAVRRSVIFDKDTGKYYATWHTVDSILTALEGKRDHAVGFNTNQHDNLHSRKTPVPIHRK